MRSAMRAATSCLEGGPLLWIWSLYLHVNKKSDDDDDNKIKTETKGGGGEGSFCPVKQQLHLSYNLKKAYHAPLEL